MPQPQDPFLTSAGWSLNELVARGRRFREIPRVSVSDQNLDATIRQHEASGVPLVIEGMHKHETWPTAIFDIQWLRDNSKQQIQVRNVPNRQDLDVPFAQFLDHVKSIPHYASVDETSRWYAKDLECPREWKEWLDTTTLIPSLLCPHGPSDIMQNLPERGRVETLMCYLGIGDTFTPCHKDLCASFGHNLMCYTEDGGSAFWFMTDSSSASSMAKYFQSLGQELDLESHAMSIEDFSAAPCNIYITEQKVGDLVLVPPRSCHQVVNHCGPTVKMSWSRMTIRSAQVALRHELPIYKRVCRAETYRTKSTIHYTLRRNTVLLEEEAKGEDGSASHDVSRRQLASDVQALLELFQEVIQEEYHPDAEILDHIIRDFSPEVYDTNGYPTFSCDFCGADIFVSFFCCKDCTLSEEKPSSVSDGLHICPGCYAEGRSCRCGGLMEPVQCWPMQILCIDYNRAVRALRVIGVDVFNEVRDEVLRNNATGIFEAGTAIQKWRTERSTNKGAGICHAKLRPHAPPDAVTLHCGKCHKSRCFFHLAESGVHSSEAIVFYRMSRDQGPFHNFHLARRKSIASDKETILAAEVSGDSFAKLIGQKLAITALSYPHCQPLNVPHIKLGWYDTLKSDGMPAPALGPSCAMDMSFPRDGDDWGSPLTEIGPEDSVSNTLVGQETPPRGADPPKSGVSVSAKVQSSAAGMVDSVKRKRTSIVFSGVAPPERKRKMSAGHTPSTTHPSRPSTSVRSDEKVQLEGHQSTRPTASLEGSLAQAISKIETLTTTIVEQNRKIEMVIHDNTGLRDEIRNLSQTLQLSKRDLQRVEYTIPKMTGELKGKFEKMLEKSESRLQGPIDRLLEELGRMRANPSAPVHMPSITTSPSNAPFAPEPVPGDGEWASRDDFILADHLNKQHYQENFERHVGPPHHKYGRGGFRQFRGRGRGFRGSYPGNRPPVQRPYFPTLPEGYGIVRVTATTTPPTQTATTPVLTTPVPVPVPVAAGSSTPRHVDPYHSHAYPPHTIPAPPTSPSTSTYSRDPRHSHADRKALPPPSPSPAPSSSYKRRWHASHSQTYERAQTSPHPPLPLPPRSQYRDDERHRVPPPPRSEADPHDHEDDGYRDARSRYGNASYTAYSPTPSDEQVRWMTTPSDSVGQLQSQSRSQSPGPGSGPSRGYAGHGRK